MFAVNLFLISKFNVDNNFSVNQVRIRDTVADDLNTFEVHKLENVVTVTGQSITSDDKSDIKNGVIMRLECESEDVKDDWVKSINSEIKQLRSMARILSSQVLLLP